MKEEVNGKRSLILFNAGTMQNRDFILMNLKKDKDYVMKKLFPKRYEQAQRKLNAMGHALGKMHDEKVNTELWYEGVSLCLWYRLKRREGEKYEEWIKQSEIDPTMEEVNEEAPNKNVKIDGTSFFVNLNEDAESEATLRKNKSDSLKDHGDRVTFKVMSKKQIGIYFQNLE